MNCPYCNEDHLHKVVARNFMYYACHTCLYAMTKEEYDDQLSEALEEALEES